MKESLSRRNLFRLVAGSGVAQIVGCGDGGKSPTPENISITIPQEVLDYYPELSPSEAKTFHTIQTAQKTVNIINYTNVPINPSKLKDFYEHLEETASLEPVSGYGNFLSGKVYTYKLQPKPPRTQNIYIVNSTSPHPSWENFEHPGVTISPTDATIPYLTRITQTSPDPQNPYLNTPEKLLNAFVAIEACQATVEVLGLTSSDATLMQEVYCNSIGNAYSVSIQGKSYAEYEDFYKNSIIPTPVGDFSFLGLPAEAYTNLPK